ncbi:PREDICTED: IgGFc-binding protein-like [Haliaeetus leucocephalus]|uniref:IgGFc-binding protein-like n=1 Tax=Haliaeetus leucocephalus TaxID=52644 RepID=UPI00053CB9BF|nr:PREDICTED: IgGFc-binding protein-like [Haliaeetus leucocephalus]
MKPSVAFLLLMLGAVMNVQPAQEKASLLYPYGPEQHDQKNPKLDDGSSKKVSLAVPFTFYGKEYRSLYVNNNGVISFDTRVNQYTPDPFPLADGRTFVAPYWADVDNVRGGDVFYRETTDPTLLARITKDINQYFPKIPYTATWAFVATWDHVAYYGSTTNKGNTFQAILTTDTKTSFIILNYWDIQWTTGAASDGDAETGLGGTPAHAGFNSGDETNFYNIPGSQTDAIINITKTSNVNVPGRWVFQVDNFKINQSVRGGRTVPVVPVPIIPHHTRRTRSPSGTRRAIKLGYGSNKIAAETWRLLRRLHFSRVAVRFEELGLPNPTLWMMKALMANSPLPRAFLGVFYLLNVAASAPHHLGEDFVVAYMQNGLQQTLNSDFKLLITGYSPFTSVTISMKKPGLRMTVQVTTGQTILVKVPPQAEMVGSKTFDNTVVVRANNAISLVMVNEKPTSVDSAVVYPVHNWGTEYHVVTPNVGTDRYGEFVVAAWDEPTVVDVHLKAAVTYQGRSYPRGSVLSIRLEPFQAAQLQSPSDMSGTRIVAQKPVAVFTGHTCLARFAHCDHLVEQLQPLSSWGTTFIVPPLPFETQSDIVYVSTSQPTRVESQHGVTKSVRELRPSRSTLYGLQALNTLYLSANAGIQVIFFADGGNKDAIFYDPFFMTIPDVSSYCHSYKIFALEGYDNYALLIAKTSETSGLMLNKTPLRNVAWKPVPGTDYSWAGQSLGGHFAVHTVEHKTSPFGLLSVGIREQKAYGSAAVCDSDPCQLVQCRAKETCKMEKGEAVCVHDYMGTCMGSQSLQYHTFDGMTVDIRGGCTYTIAKYCGNDPTLVPFVVEEKKSEGDLKEWLTHIYVYSYNISIHIGEGGKIQVNNKPTNLPATLEAGKIQISQNEGRTILQTDFGLQVTYDEDWAIMVAVPSSYFGGTCGLCGNFNEDSEDEVTLSDGAQASSVEDWAESWRDPSCQDDCEDQETLQDTAGCAQKCPQNSHFEACGTACPPTCTDPKAPASCGEPCTAGCRCNEGFVLHNDSCVPVETCGCFHNGRSYKVREEFWEDGSCQSRCRCKANGAVECEEVFCSAHEECRVEDGVLGCYPAGYGRLVVSGDPHYVTFDGRAFDLQGSCTYVLARVCKPERRLTNFSVVLEHDVGGRGNVALMKKVVISIHGYTVGMERGKKWEVTVDGERYTLPLVTEDKKLRIGQEGNNVVLQSAAGLRLLYNAATYLLVTIPDSYRGRVCGLGGNYNGDPGDDFQLPGGSLAQSTEEFVTSWKTPVKDRACTDGCHGKACPACDAADAAPYGAGDSCGLIRDPAGPFGSCHPRVSPVEYFNHCVHDVCAANGAQDILCQSLQAYVAACQAAGAEIGRWRTTTFCPLSCPPHSHYELCTRTCDFTCASLSVPAPCSWTCFEGCQCDDGYLFDGEACVSLEQCGCMHQGRYFKAGETIISSNCSKKCNCHLSQGLVCEDIRCPPDEVCATRDGVQQCVRREGQCRVSPGATLTTFDGAGGKLLASGTYKVAALCDEQSPNWFKVVVDVSECRDDSIPAAVAVFIFFREAFITVNNNMEVWVNGLFTRLPTAVSDAISLSAVAGNITVSHTSGMDVVFSPNGEVTVTVGASLVNRLCAPCGNFNGDPSDDLKLPDGRTVRNIAEVVDAWKARDFAGCRASNLVRMEVEAPVYPMQ